MEKIASLSIGIILICTTAWSQNERTKPAVTRVSFERHITLDNDSKAENVIVTIEPGTEVIDLLITSTIENGKLTIELFNPVCAKQGHFTVETQLDAKKQERVAGKLQKSIEDPQPGDWKIKIVPTAVKGSMQIQTAHKQ